MPESLRKLVKTVEADAPVKVDLKSFDICKFRGLGPEAHHLPSAHTVLH